MPNSVDENEEREQQLDAIIAEYYRDEEAGKAPDHNEFIAQHPEFAKELTEFFADIGILQDANLQKNDYPALEPTIIPDKSQPTKSAAGQVVRYFGEYEILEELGTGGMGVVYKARQTKLKRIVALKMIRSSELANSQDVQRFEAEAKAAAKLSHPGIVSVHEVGIHNGHHFYTMDYVEGGSLSRLLRDRPVAAKHAAKLVRRLAESMHYAHQQGIVHRDLKPANVLLTAKGAPRITDFGLAKRLRTDDESHAPTMTESGAILGTAGYMPPEQAAGKSSLVGPAADIYSLGAVLYALLTSRAPFVGETPSHTIMQVLRNEPVSPRIINPGVPRDLETICLKCLQKEPHKRYGTAQLLAEDLALFLKGKPVNARPVSSIERSWRWCRRNAVIAGLLATLIVSLLIGTGVSWYFKYQSDQRADANFTLAENESKARKLADQRKAEADRSTTLAETRLGKLQVSERLSRRHLYISHMNLIQAAWDDQKMPGQLSRIANLLERHVPDAGEEDLRSFEWHYWNRRCNESRKEIYDKDILLAIEYHPNGKQIAIAGLDGTVRICDVESGKLLHELEGHTGEVRCLSYNATGSLLASGSADNTIIVWDGNTHQRKVTIKGDIELEELDEGFSSVAFSPDGSLIASASDDGSAIIWDPETGKPLQTLGEPDLGNGLVAFSANGRVLAYVRSMTFEVWEINPPGSPDRFRRRHSQSLFLSPTDVACNWDGTLIALGGMDWDSTAICDTRTGQMFSFGTDSGAVNCITFRPDGRQLISGDRVGQIKIWDVSNATLLQSAKEHSGMVLALGCSPDGSHVASTSDDGLKIWNPAMGRIPRTLQVPEAADTDFFDVSFSPDSSQLGSCDQNGVIAIWDLKTGAKPRILAANDSVVESDYLYGFCMEFNHDGTMVAVAGGSSDFTVQLRDSQTGRTIHQLKGHTGRITSACFSPDGSLIAAGSEDDSVKVWNVVSGTLAATLAGAGDFSFSPDGKLIATAGGGNVRIWDTETYQLLRTVKAGGIAKCVAFSPTERSVACGFSSGLSILNLDDPSAAASLSIMESIDRIAFSPDGRRVAGASHNGDHAVNAVIRFWDTQTGEEILRLVPDGGEPGSMLDLEFSRDGSKLAACTSQGTLVLWDCDKPIELKQADSAPPMLRSTPLWHERTGLAGALYISNENQAVTIGYDKKAHLVDLRERQELKRFNGHNDTIWTVAVSPDAQTLLTGSEDKTARFWNMSTGKEHSQFLSEGVYSSVRFSADGENAYATNWDKRVRIWKRPFSELPVEFSYDDTPLDLVVLPDGLHFVIGTLSGDVILCDAKTGEIIKRFSGHKERVHGVAVVDAGKRILSASHDRTIRLWDLESGQVLRTFKGHTAAVNGIQVLPDAKRCVSCSVDGTLRLWDLESAHELARGSTGVNLRGLSVAADGKSCLTAGLDGTLLQWELSDSTSVAVATLDDANLPQADMRKDNADPPVAPGSTTSSTSVRLLSPEVGAVLPNGSRNFKTNREWEFDWADVPNATKYHLVVKGASAKTALIDRNDISETEWKDTRTDVVPNRFLRNWTWKVRAFVNGEWTEWSEVRTFDVEATR